MNQEEKIRRSHRLCPCNPMDIEGIQTWLEDMAAEGLLLEKDSIFCGFWSFIKGQPQKVRYRLEVVRSSFLDDNDNPGTEMVETAQAMGWEYVTRFRSFYIYRTFDSQARPLNTDPAVQSLTIKKLRRHQYVDMILDVAYVFVIFSCGAVPSDICTVTWQCWAFSILPAAWASFYSCCCDPFSRFFTCTGPSGS